MTDDDSTATDDATGTERPTTGDGGPDDPAEGDERPGDSTDRDDPEDAVEALTERVAELERIVAWMARQQAAETGSSVCPDCNSGGSLRVSRTPTGKKRVECRNCGQTFN